MNILHRLSFELWYLGRAPWDSRIVPPEVVAFLGEHPPGRVLDLGCGSGTSCLVLADAGWQVTGVDFSARAISIARRRAAQTGMSVDFMQADVIRLPALPGPFDLVLDIGCFHGLSQSGKAAYLARLVPLLAPGGTWLMYGFFKAISSPGPGLVEADLQAAAASLTLVQRQDGTDKKARPSAWFEFTRGEVQPG